MSGAYVFHVAFVADDDFGDGLAAALQHLAFLHVAPLDAGLQQLLQVDFGQLCARGSAGT